MYIGSSFRPQVGDIMIEIVAFRRVQSPHEMKLAHKGNKLLQKPHVKKPDMGEGKEGKKEKKEKKAFGPLRSLRDHER